MAVIDLPATAAGSAYDAFADLYDTFTWDHDYERWVTALEELAQAHGPVGRRLLDVACGTGKSILPWLERGYEVTGCDVSARMLERAGVKTGGRARLLLADMRDLPAGEPFDLVTCLGDSVNYLLDPRDLPRAFGAVSRRLCAGGLYLFDLNSLRTYREDFAMTRRFEREGWEFCWTGHGDRGLEAGGEASATISGHGAGSAMSSHHVQRHHPIALVREALGAAGLEPIRVHGQHRDGSLDPEFAELRHSKALVVARTPAPR